MKILFLLVLTFFISINHGYTQVICHAPDSIIAMYKDDADRLALRKIHKLNLPHEDSVEIPQIISDTFLNALLAVYNAVEIPERDTVVTLLDIHTFPNPLMRTVLVTADSNLFWMHQLRNGIIPTGYQPLDSIIDKYDLTIDSYETWYNWFFWHAVVFKSPRNYNIPPLASAFETLPDVYFSEPQNIAGDGHDIDDHLFYIVGENLGLDLFYIYGWGDCPAGCTQSRVWWFKIYEDCEVELHDVFGSTLPFTSIDEHQRDPITLFPNPFQDEIFIEGISNVFEYSISDLNGHKVSEGMSNEMSISNLIGLVPGFYILTINERERISVHKLVKR